MTSSLTAPPRYFQPTRPYILTTHLSLPKLYPQVNKAIGPHSYRNFGLILLVGAGDDGARDRVHEQVETEISGAGVAIEFELLDLYGMHRNEIPVHAVS